MNAFLIVGLLLSGALIALLFMSLGAFVTMHFDNIAYRRYQQGITDGWKARGVRNGMSGEVHDTRRTQK